MTASISKDFEFVAGTRHDDEFSMISYIISLDMEVHTDNPLEQYIALGRMKYLIQNKLDSCMFIKQTNTAVIDAYSAVGLNVCPLPEEPYDQVIAAVLIQKMNAILEGKILVNYININSSAADDVTFGMSSDLDIFPDALSNSWWKTNSTTITNAKLNKKGKIVSIKKEALTWADIGLSWTPIEDTGKDNEIAFMNTPISSDTE